MQPHVFTIAKFDGLIGQGVSDAVLVQLNAVAKTNDIVDTTIANVYIAATIGRFIGLPIAPGAIVRLSKSPKTMGYAALKFNLAGETLPDVDPADLVRKLPRLATGLVMFDVLIINPDRHTGNLSALLQAKNPEMLVFDHGHSLLGHDSSKSLKRLASLQTRLGITGGIVTEQNRHCLLDHLDDETYFQEWTERIAAIPDFLITDACIEMRDMNFITDVHAITLIKFLKYRRDYFRLILANHKNEFKGIRQWSLL